MKMALIVHHRALTEHGWLQKEQCAYLINAHDEFQLEAEPSIADMVGRLIPEAIQEAGRRLNIRCPLTGEYKIGNNWAETH